ncbi:MAG TPA: PIN domain-containing protein, partial [Spirochaetota bacterium]|nr:PIN domain-containing protein [Spirochaetota bacterium]
MPDKVFIDTNIFVYLTLDDPHNTEKRDIAKSLLDSMQGSTVAISVQVLNELYNVLIKNKISDSVIQKKLNDIIRYTAIQSITEDTVRSAWKIRMKYKYSVYDSLIIASALESQC